MRRTIVVLAKGPEETAGELRGVMGSQEAACLHECFLLDTLEKAAAVPDAELVVCSATGDDLAFLQEVAPRWTRCVPGEGMDLGRRMEYCLEQVGEPDSAVVFLSPDAPNLPARSLELAFDALAAGHVDVVIGPCSNNGWYLVGMARPEPSLLQGADWEDPESIIERAIRLQKGWYLLPEWRCVRTAEDLDALRGELPEPSMQTYSACRTREFLRATPVG